MKIIFNPFSGNLDFYNDDTVNNPANPLNSIQYNDGGSFGGDAGLTYNDGTGTITATYFVGDGSGLENVGATAATALSFNCAVSEAVKKGQAVYIVGGASALPNIAKADNTSTTKSRVVGIVVSDAGSGTTLVRRGGTLTNVDTRTTNTNVNPLAQTWLEGDLLFATSGGGLTKVRPTSGRSVKVAYSLKGSSQTDTLLIYPMENPVWVTAASAEDIVLRMGDASAVNKVSLRDYANAEVGYFNSDGGGLLTSLLTPTINGGTAANDDITIQGTTDATRTTSYVNLQPNGGNVGIGTTAPAYALDVVGGVRADSNSYAFLAPNGWFYAQKAGYGLYSAAAGVLTIRNSNASGSVDIRTGGDNIRATFDSAGNVGIGTTGPTSKLHLAAGTATAGTAPLGFTSGTLLTVPVVGKVEFLTDAWYGTITTGAARKTFAFLESPVFTTQITTPAVLASSNDSGALGASGTAFSDLFLASEAVINFAAGDITITHAADKLTIGGGPLYLSTNPYITNGIYIVGATSAQSYHVLNSVEKSSFGANSAYDLFFYNMGASQYSIAFDSSNQAFMPSTYADTVGATNRDLYIDNTGLIGYVSSSIRYKENVVDINDTSWIYNLRPVKFDYKDKTKGINKMGLIAEEVEAVKPELVSYVRTEIKHYFDKDRNEITKTAYDNLPKEEKQEAFTTSEYGEDKALPDTVSYSNLITPVIAELKKLKSRVDSLEANSGTPVAQVVALTPAASINITATASLYTLSPNQNTTLTASGGVAGKSFDIVIITTGVIRTITFGGDFKSAGTLSTGNTTGKKFVISVIFDGTHYIEKSRTTAR